MSFRLGEDPAHVFIRANGPQTPQLRLSRSALFRPGCGPIGVVLPDNAWEMGFCDVALGGGRGLTAIARRQDSASAELRRFRADPSSRRMGDLPYAHRRSCGRLA